MRTQTNSGFTIIEVMLFLAITGALTVGILVGSGAAIGQQRYRDSVNSFKGYIQEQYGQIANVVNSETLKPVCSQSGENVVFGGNNQQPRGTSDCLIMGRFLLIEPTMLTAYNLVGLPPATVTGGGDTIVLGQYSMTVQLPETKEINWGARIVRPETTDGVFAAVLLIRSPLSGSILTYIQDLPDLSGVPESDRLAIIRTGIKEMIENESMVQKDFCVDSGGGSGISNRLAVRINERAANQSAIEIPLEEEGVCD